MYELIENTGAILHQPTERFNFDNPPVDPYQLATDLAEAMIRHNGLGLSANQVGLKWSVFAITGDPVRVCFNPRIVDKSDEEIYLDEGCLSWPGLFVKIKRPKSVRVRFTLPNGETLTETFTGMTARIFQHEYDHLQGYNYQQRANRIHLDRARREYKKWKRQQKNQSSAP